MTSRAVLVIVALAAAIAPMPAGVVERVYSNGLYPPLQAAVTSATNLIPVAVLDVCAGAMLAAGIVVFVRRVRQRGISAGLQWAAGSLAVLAAVLYLWFLAMWGLNYRRMPMETKLDYDRVRVTREGAVRLAGEAVSRVNRLYGAAHAQAASDEALFSVFVETISTLGGSRVVVAGVTKRSLLTHYFRRAAIDGMTDPFFLEIIVVPDLLPFERPSVLAHEWAHLAGYADESEANFVAWLGCLRGDSLAQYSGWLAIYEQAGRVLTRDEHRMLMLDPGPRADLAASAARYRRSSPVVREGARVVYDKYLRANRIPEGIESYAAALRLMLGTRFDDQWRPERR